MSGLNERVNTLVVLGYGLGILVGPKICEFQISRGPRDAQNRGATIFPRVKFIASERTNNYWKLTFQNQNIMQEYQQNARYLINVASPWVGDVLQKQLGQNAFYANMVPRQKKF